MLMTRRSCPRCHGDLFLDWDEYGQYLQCLQCGYLHDLVSQVAVERHAQEKEMELALAGRSERGSQEGLEMALSRNEVG